MRKAICYALVMTTHETLLRRFGPTDAVIAEKVGGDTKDYNVRDWRHRGIPAERYADVLDAAKRYRIKLSAGELISAQRKRPRERV